MNVADVERSTVVAHAEAAEQVADLERRLAEAQREIEELQLTLAYIEVLLLFRSNSRRRLVRDWC